MQKLFVFIAVCLSAFYLKAQTITLTQTSPEIICSASADTVEYKVSVTNIPANANIVVYESTNPTFNPYLGQGNQIANIEGDSIQSSNSCIRMLGLFIDACLEDGGDEGQNEYMTIASGSGIKVSNLAIDFGKSNNAQSVLNADINFGAGACPFRVPQAALITNLRANSPCNSTNIIPAGPTDSIPPNAIILVFTSDDVRSTYNMSGLCAKGFPIYVLQNDCRRTIGAFSNVSNSSQNCTIDSNRYRHYVVRNLATGCYDSLVYDRCHSTSGYTDGTYVVNLPGIDTLNVANGGIKSSSSCSGIDYTADGLNYQEVVRNTDTTFKFVLSPAFCNTGYHYIKAITNPPGTQPVSNTIKFKLVCLDVTATPQRQTICSGQNIVINNTSTDASATFSWTVAASATISGASAGSGTAINQTLTYSGATRDSIVYTITANDDGCTKTTTAKVIVNANNVTPINLGNDTTYCGSFSRKLTTGNASTVWNNNVGIPSTTSDSLRVTQPGKYWATITGSCGSVSDTINIAQSAGLTFSFGGNTSVCQSSNTTLDAGSGYDIYNWNTNEHTQAITITAPGKYWVDVFKNGCKGNDTIIVTQIAKPAPFFLGNDTSFCGTVSKNLSSGNPQTAWSLDGNFIVTAPGITANQFGQYVAKVTNSCGSFADTINITPTGTLQPINLGNDTSYCGSFSRKLSTGNNTTVWNNNVGIPSTTSDSIRVTQPGKYWATITGSCGSVSDTINIAQSPGLPFSFGGNTSVCQSSNTTLDAGSGYDIYNWNTNEHTQAITITAPGKYWVDVFKNGCKGNDTITVTQINKPSPFSLGNDTSFCNNFSFALNAPVANAVWNNNVSVPSTTASQITVTKAGKYWATITNSCGSVSDTIQINQNLSPTAFNLGNDTSICGSFSKTISTGNNTTVWNNNVGVPSTTGPQITVTQLGKYWATISNSCGTAQDTIEFKNGSNLLVNIGDTITKCVSSNVVLNAGTGFSTYLWNTSAVSQTITVSNPGKYFVDVTKNNCKGSDTVMVVDVQKPTITSLGNDTTYCGNFSQTLSTGDATTKWNTNVTAAQITVNAGGQYIATITNVCGSISDTIIIKQNPLPVVNLGNDQEFCDSLELSIGNNSFQSIRWNTNDSVNTILVKNGGVYFVQVIDTNNCKNSDTVNIKKVCDYTVYMPAAFSPNHDGVNDILVPLSKISGIIIQKFIIFNRWNEKVFEAYNFAPNDKAFGWNGDLKNAEQQVDNYVFVITAILPDNTVKDYKGIITLLK